MPFVPPFVHIHNQAHQELLSIQYAKAAAQSTCREQYFSSNEPTLCSNYTDSRVYFMARSKLLDIYLISSSNTPLPVICQKGEKKRKLWFKPSILSACFISELKFKILKACPVHAGSASFIRIFKTRQL